tara:strand:+ start:2792 stop:3187 length:396 start_codon:yes stop_codon:yes gene_type:complete
MVLNSSLEDAALNVQKEYAKLKRSKEFKQTVLPDGDIEMEDIKEKNSKNPFLDTSVRDLIDAFVLTWHKIIFDLLEINRYDKLLEETEWWDKLKEIIKIFIDVFWIDDRIFHVGIGFIIASFFVFFILVSQ